MKKIITLIFTITISTGMLSQTTVNGNQSGTWSAINSPYEVIGEIVVPNGQTLSIEPGVEVNFQGHYKFTVNGLLEAVGTEIDSIRFTTDNHAIGWGGIRIDATDISTLSFCRIEFGKSGGDYPDMHGGGLALLGSDVNISNTVFADNDATGDNLGMGGAVYAIGTNNSSFSDCRFVRNHCYGEGGAIKFSGDTNTEITNCEFIENNCNYGGGAISFYYAVNTKMTHCLFVNNYTMYSSGGALHTLAGGNIIIENCTIYGNTAVTGDGGGISLAYTHADIVNSIITNNPGMYSDDVFLDLAGSADINYSNLIMPAGATGGNNINVDSEFVDVVNLDFHLLETSPCIDAGTDIGLPFVGSAPDMGCFEYDPAASVNTCDSVSLTIYPNPSTGIFRINSDKQINNVKLFDVYGKVVLEKYFKRNTSNYIDAGDLGNGTYFLRILTNDNESLVKKIIF